ncbi:Ribonuclease H, partial [Parasponia andersonii]
AALIREESNIQRPVYYVSKRLLDAETRYPDMEKLALALVIASRKLQPYFHAHSIRVFTNFPLRQVLQKPETSGRLLKWAVELSQFDINFQPRTAIKGQALADFIAEFTYDVNLPTGVLEKPASDTSKLWKLYVDGSSNENGAGAGIVLISLEGHNIHYALRFKFPTSNNEAEYEALIAGLKLAQEMKVEAIEVYSDSQLVVCQVKGGYHARGERMMAYLKKVQ